MLKKVLNGMDWALELAVGGPLQIFQDLLVHYPFKVDVNDIARNQMLDSYASEDRIMDREKKQNKYRDHAKIVDRF